MNKERIPWWKEEGYNSREDCEKQRTYRSIISSFTHAVKQDKVGALDERFDERLRAFIETEIISLSPVPEELRKTCEECFRWVKEAREARPGEKAKAKARLEAIDKAVKENSLSGYFAAIEDPAK
jgi:hypothetical protein